MLSQQSTVNTSYLITTSATSTPFKIQTILNLSTATSTPFTTKTLKHKRRSPKKRHYKTFNLENNTLVSEVVVQFKRSKRIRKRLNTLKLIDRKDDPYFTANKMRTNRALYKLKKILKKRKLSIEKYFVGITEQSFDEWHEIGERNSGDARNNLNDFYSITLPEGTRFKKIKKLLSQLNKNSIVELAYAKDTQDALPAGDTFYSPGKSFLSEPSSGGVNARAAWNLYGAPAKGQNVNVIDLEHTWRKSHSDFPSNLIGFENSGATQSELTLLLSRYATYSEYLGTVPFLDPVHGNGVIGIIAAKDNNIGITGIAPLSRVGLQPTRAISGAGQKLCQLLPFAANRAGSGGIVVAPLAKPFNGRDAPIDWDPACFSAIRSASDTGKIIVISAGNTSVDLDGTSFDMDENDDGIIDYKYYNRQENDSGAIVVAMSEVDNRKPHFAPFNGNNYGTNYGSRIDAHAPYGPITLALPPIATTTFGGTSGAAAIVAGALASIQGIAKSQGKTLNAIQMRSLIKNEGVPQTHDLNQAISRLPNILKFAQNGLPRLFPPPPPPNPQAAKIIPPITLLLLDD